MKGIFITEEGKKEIEDKIAELEEDLKEEVNSFIYTDVSAELNTYKRILFYATILPVEESWEKLSLKSVGSTHAVPSAIVEKFEQGIIIQPKQ
jgi:hypothetical protein